MARSDKHDLVLCREVLVIKSKERGDVSNQIPVNLSGPDHPKFKVNKRATRDSRLTLLITKHKAKICQLENAT